MSRRPPKPPKQWDPRHRVLRPAISGVMPNGQIVVHPERFAELVRQGVIDQHGNYLHVGAEHAPKEHP